MESSCLVAAAFRDLQILGVLSRFNSSSLSSRSFVSNPNYDPISYHLIGERAIFARRSHLWSRFTNSSVPSSEFCVAESNRNHS